MTFRVRTRPYAPRSAGAIALAAVMLGGCTGPAPVEEEFALGACDLLETATVEAIVGARVDSEEHSVDHGAPADNWIVCSYSPADGGARRGLYLRVDHSGRDDAAFYDDVSPACEDGILLDVEGAIGYICADPRADGSRGPHVVALWGDDLSYLASIQVVAFENAPTVAEMAEPLRAAVRDLIASVDESDFTDG
ncbi:hypothetical protein ACFY9N_13790 [Microbacterium sp. NPDC008134]|uniref:hypothetical protein n=1 Tax=Microbacterium sp. NPDC008134 TaxID=3364183 RepID=UPI0036E0CB84